MVMNFHRHGFPQRCPWFITPTAVVFRPSGDRLHIGGNLSNRISHPAKGIQLCLRRVFYFANSFPYFAIYQIFCVLQQTKVCLLKKRIYLCLYRRQGGKPLNKWFDTIINGFVGSLNTHILIINIHEKESREEESDLGCRTILFITWPLFGLLARPCLNSRGESRKQRRGSRNCAAEWKCQRYRERPKRRALDRREYSCKRNNKWHRL